jgi:hypothetical protein
MPITYCRPLDGVKLSSIGLVEGILKPYITAQKLNQIVIGAPGSNWASYPKQLKQYLSTAAAELNTKNIVFYPDSGAVANNSVMAGCQRVIEMIKGWGYSIQVAWWGQLTKEQQDIDELDNFDSLTYLSPEEFLELAAHSGGVNHSFAGILTRLKGWLGKQRSSWGFGRKDELEAEPLPAKPEILEYEEGKRLEEWENAIRRGARYILDISPTGKGKTYEAGLLQPQRLGVRQLIYISDQHRNPTTPTFRDGWVDLEARHDGLYSDEFDKLRRVTGQKPSTVEPNCGRNKTITALRSKNIPGSDTSELVCSTCPELELCRMGIKYGFLNQRAMTLQEPRVRSHPDSLPDPAYQPNGEDEYKADFIPYAERALVIDEATENIKVHRSVEIKASDISQAITTLLIKHPEALNELGAPLTTLLQLVNGDIKQPNMYGWSDAKIRQALPQVGEIDLDAIKKDLTPDPTPLIDETKSKHGVSSADLPRQLRKSFTGADNSTAQEIIKDLPLNWLPDFLDVLLENQLGTLRIQNKVLTMTLGDERMAKITAAAKSTILLDATATDEDIARRLNVDVKDILIMRQATEDTKNLEVIQVQMGQRLGIGSRRKDKEDNDTFLEKRIKAVINHIEANDPSSKMGIFDFKRHSEEGDGKHHHWVDTRGVNDLEDYDGLISTGIACRAVPDLEAQFTQMYGRRPQEGTVKVKYAIQVNNKASTDQQPYLEVNESVDPEFRAFVRRSILADIHQTIGRLRAHCRPDKKIPFYILGDYPLDIPVTLVKAGDLTPDAATKKERVEMAIRKAVAEIKAKGEKVTQAAIAAITGLTQGYISRFRELLQTLLDDSYSKSNNFADPPPDPDQIEWNGQEYLSLLAEESTEEIFKGMLTTFEAHGQVAFKAIWDATPAATQVKILKTLLLVLPAGDLQLLGVKT